MTPRRLEILKFIAKYIDHAGCSPTLAELAGGVDLSTVAVLEHVGRLQQDGFLTRRSQVARSIRLTEAGLVAARSEPSVTLSIVAAKALFEGCRRALPTCPGDVADFIRDALDQVTAEHRELIGVEA